MERKDQRVNHYVRKKWTRNRDIMSWWSNVVEFDNLNSENEHNANPPKLKRRKASASSSGYRTGLAGSKPTRVLRSRKLVQEKVTLTSAHYRPCTILSWLIDNDVVFPSEKVHYCTAKGSHPMAQGTISRLGIVCNCCQKVFSLCDFESHAGCSENHVGCSNHIPAANIFLDDGRSILDCQMQLLSEKRKRSCRSQPHGRIKGNWTPGENDSFCTVCCDGGHLVLCDLCPSAFHKSCIGLKDVPDGDWFCPACCCGLCGQSILKKDRKPTMHYRTCGQCEREYHTGCLRKISADMLESDPKGNWFCRESCKKIYLGLHECLGKQFPAGIDSLTWSLLKSDSKDTNEPNNDAITETYSRLNLAVIVMHECFKPFKKPHTGTDLAEDIIFSRGSDRNRMNCQGFYTMLLEKNDEIISVATVRIYGAQVAEIPLIGTKFQYRRGGMCRLLMHLLEKMLMNLGVERLVLPTVPHLLDNWSSFGFSKMTDSQRLQVLDYRFMEFRDTIICQKSLMKIPLAEPCPSEGTPLFISGSVDNMDSNGSSGDNVSITWKIDNFSTLLCIKKYSDTFLTGQLRWRILLFPNGRESVDDLSVSFDVEGGSELPLGWSRYAQLSMTMVNQLQRSKSITKESRHVFNRGGSDCGFTSLIPLNELHDPSKGYLVNDTCIIEANITVCKARIQISHDQKTGLESVDVPNPSTAARRASCFKNVTAVHDATTSQHVYIELSDASSEPMEVPDLSSATRKATSFQHMTASQDTASSAEVIKFFSGTSTDHSLDEEFDVVSSTSPSDLLNFRGLADIKKDFVPLLEEVCLWHPSLIECQRKSSPQFTEWAFTALGKVLHFLKTKKVKDMTTYVCKDLQILWNELKAFGFDLTWLKPHVERALGMSKFVESTTELKRAAENVKALEIESKRLKAKLAAARSDLDKAGQGFEEIMDSELGYHTR
ncbi:uncharacterized protein LOC112173256 isoform X2 [Rosa chinensis]|uniref:uncharacterized protein LOC112173256 isoform X2 n=1 Tax=Rosa chinensis TaxID=74649 RepID=UPI001AD8BB91|nr:uncharacterized protein LOC112173256 isoform X2 [Rosa chinensis]